MNESLCENCQKQHDKSFGSGRFCSETCCRSFSTKEKRLEINKKVSLKLKNKQVNRQKSNFWKRPENKEKNIERNKKISEKLKKNWVIINNNKNYEGLKLVHRKKILWKSQGEKCNICDYNLDVKKGSEAKVAGESPKLMKLTRGFDSFRARK
jgi:hypothetical protein